MTKTRFPATVRFLLLVFLVSLASCGTGKGMSGGDVDDFKSSDFLGMVYDSRNRPCGGTVIRIGESENPVSSADVNGRFVIGDLARGPHTLRVSKEGFESQDIAIDYTSRKQILYVRLVSQESLIDWAEESMESLEWAEADALLSRAEAVDPENSRYLAIRGTLDYLTGRYTTATAVWMRLIEKGHKDPYLCLMIADACEYGLRDTAAAATWLERFLEYRDDGAVSDRLAALRESD